MKGQKKRNTDERIKKSLGTNNVETDYLIRERRENEIEQGYGIVEISSEKSDVEKSEYYHTKMLERLEEERCPRYPKQESEDNPMEERKEQMEFVNFTNPIELTGYMLTHTKAKKSGLEYTILKNERGDTILIGARENGTYELTNIKKIQKLNKKINIVKI